jgi:hypothetical protein
MSMNFEFSEVLPDSFEYFDEGYPSDKYSNADAGAIAQGVGVLGEGIGGAVGKSADRKTAQEMSKTSLQKEIDTRCGKDKSRSLSKKKKETYNSCKQNVIKTFDAQNEKDSKIKSEQNKIALRVSESKKNQKNILYIGAGILLFVGVVIYLRNKTKNVGYGI